MYKLERLKYALIWKKRSSFLLLDLSFVFFLLKSHLRVQSQCQCPCIHFPKQHHLQNDFAFSVWYDLQGTKWKQMPFIYLYFFLDKIRKAVLTSADEMAEMLGCRSLAGQMKIEWTLLAMGVSLEAAGLTLRSEWLKQWDIWPALKKSSRLFHLKLKWGQCNKCNMRCRKCLWCCGLDVFSLLSFLYCISILYSLFLIPLTFWLYC